MLMGLSGRLVGFSSFSMLLPEALCGIASVLLLHKIVRRTLGPRAALLAALTRAHADLRGDEPLQQPRPAARAV